MSESVIKALKKPPFSIPKKEQTKKVNCAKRFVLLISIPILQFTRGNLKGKEKTQTKNYYQIS